MHVRVSSVRRNGKTYRYAQLVESYRRPSDGQPAHRVIATLGDPDDPVVENMRQALDAARKGRRVVLARSSTDKKTRAPKPTANLRYLDIAVLLELWRQWGLDEIFDELLPRNETGLVPPSAVVAALTLQRCVDPGSKLSATRWLPRTSLVELLGIPVESFNNTRLHRVLDDLDGSTSALMAKLPPRYEQRDGTFASLFMDVTDTWFVGHGCDLAERGKTKEGKVERKIGIVLLCNEHGYPLRWDVVRGTQHDSKAMTAMMKAVGALSWVGEAPLVCDRAMGHTAHIREMAASGVRFVTALTEAEFGTYAPRLPHAAFAELAPTSRDTRTDDVARAARAAEAAGLLKVSDTQFVMDVGVIECAGRAPMPRDNVGDGDARDATIVAMEACRQINDLVAQERYPSYQAAGRSLGFGSSLVRKYRGLRGLSEQQQRDVLDGKLAGCTLVALLNTAKIAADDERQQAFDALMSTSCTASPRRARTPARHDAEESSRAPLKARVAVYFNPERFVDERLRAKQRVEDIQSFAKELNTKLASPRSSLTKQRVEALIDRRLRKESFLDAFDVGVTETGNGVRARLNVAIVLKPTTWARRRRYDGFTVLVAHPELPHTAIDLCRLYREKDAVEKDFQVIKSVVELRPVRHQTDAKVRAHVTICMLALLLERTLRRRLRTSSYSSQQALDILQTCQLNLYANGAHPPAYTITQPAADQSTILRTLRLAELTDDDVLAARMTPR